MKKQLVSHVCVIAILTAISLIGCAPRRIINKSNFDKWKAMTEISKGHTPPAPASAPSEVRSEPASSPAPPPDESSEKLLPGSMVALNMQDVDVSVMLKTLAKAAGVNMIINQNVKGKATIHVAQSPWKEVFLGILRSQNLSYAWEGNILRIISPDDITEEIRLTETDYKKKLQKQKEKQTEPLITDVMKISFADPEELKKSFEQVLKGEEGDKQKNTVAVDMHTRSLIVRAREDDIAMIRELVKKLDIPAPQVLIEAHIVEATRETAWELGIQWGGLQKIGSTWITPDASSALTTTAQTTTSRQQISSSAQTGTINTPLEATPGMAVNLPMVGAGTGLIEGLNLGFVMQDLGRSILAMQLSSLQQDGRLKILSSPSITTLDNQTATIESGKEVPFQTVENGEVNVEFKKAVLSLKVTPHVIDSKILKMNIVTHKDELDFTKSVAGNPTIITKNAETNVVLSDGDTTVIGGLSKEMISDSEAGIPMLQDIPLLGYLFKRKSNSDNLEEILIFITPHILK